MAQGEDMKIVIMPTDHSRFIVMDGEKVFEDAQGYGFKSFKKVQNWLARQGISADYREENDPNSLFGS